MHDQATKKRLGGTPGARWSLFLALPLLIGGCDTDELLEVDIPGRVPEEALADPDLAETLVLSVMSDLECAWDNYVAGSAVHSDEYWHATGNLLMRNWGQRRIIAEDANLAQGTCDGWGYGFYTPLQTARYQAQDVYNRLAEFSSEEVPDKASLQATVRAYGGFSLIAFGEGFCSTAFDGGPELTPDEVLTLAEEHFTEAISLAQQSGNTEVLNMALVGRARVRLNREDFSGVIEDASQVPEGFVKYATRDGGDPRRYNTHYEYVNGPSNRQANIAPTYWNLEWKGVPDPRVTVINTGEVAADAITIHRIHNKITGRDSGVLLASYKEAQLFLAEAAARTGDLATARRIINERHALAGIPSFDEADGPTQADVIRQVIEERRRELFVEGGHRLNDHLRFDGTEFEVPFKGEPGSYHPDGLDQLGLPYGDTTCWPLPELERVGNPNISR